MSLVSYAKLLIELAAVSLDRCHHMRGDVRVGQLICPGVGRANRIAGVDRRFSQSYLTVLADQLFDKELLFSGQRDCAVTGAGPGSP